MASSMRHTDAVDHFAANKRFMLIWVYIMTITSIVGILRIW